MPGDDATRNFHRAMPFAEVLGIEVITLGAAEVTARVDWDGSRCTAGGILHGGVLMALADSCGGYCAFLHLPDGAGGTATIASKTNFLRGGGSGGGTATSAPLDRKSLV